MTPVRPPRWWLPLSALLLVLAFVPWSRWAEALEGVLPPLLILVAPAPALAAVAAGADWRAWTLFTALWWLPVVSWLIWLDPQLGIPCWLVTAGIGGSWTLLLGWLLRRLRRRWGPSLFLWWAPVVWMAWEGLKGGTSLGTPWCSLVHAFWRLPVLCQLAEVTGAGALSAVVVCCAAGLARWLLGRRHDALQAAFGLGLLAGLAFYGAARLAAIDVAAGPAVRVALVQPNVPFADKRTADPALLLDDALALTAQAPRDTELAVWPETAVPTHLAELPQYAEPMAAEVRRLGLSVIAGALYSCRGDGSWEPARVNAALVYAPDGRVVEVAAKVRIVPFGEYTPGRRYRLMRSLARKSPQFFAAPRFRAVDSPVGRLGLAICYESIFAADTRTLVRDGAQALVAITNDDQLLQMGARQHYQQAVFRCIETRRWLARSANGGISAFVDPAGRVVAQTPWSARAVLPGTIRLRGDRTPFVRLGPWCWWLALAASAWALFGRAPRKRDTM
jgi:apolipoprotein N-acyltransferase